MWRRRPYGTCRRLAPDRYGLHTLRAAVAHQNPASRKVLTRAGFLPTGPAGPADLGGKHGTWYRRDLTLLQAPEREDDGHR